MCIVALPSQELALVVEMQFEVLLDVNLSRQLLRIIGLLVRLRQVRCFCGRLSVQGDAGSTCRVWQVLDLCWQPHIRSEGGLCSQMCGHSRVGQGGDGGGSLCKGNSLSGRAASQPRYPLCVQTFTLWLHLPIDIAHVF